MNSYTPTQLNNYYHSVGGNYYGTYPYNPIYCVPPEWTTVVTPGFTPGSVGMHITQMVRKLGSATVYNATGFVANSLDYQVQVRLFDSATVPKLIGNSAIMPLVNNWTSIFSNMPLTWDVEVFPDAGKNTPATDNYPLTMWYGGQGFVTAQPAGADYTVCSVGGYNDGIRQMDCRFVVNA